MFQIIGRYPDYDIPRLLQTTNDRIQTTETICKMQYLFLKDLCQEFLPEVPKSVIMVLTGMFLALYWLLDVLGISMSYYFLLVGVALMCMPILKCFNWETCKPAVDEEPTAVFVTDCIPRAGMLPPSMQTFQHGDETCSTWF